ncbi:hypothetical protein CLOM_g6712 [Closterium sp. NIES-68]|nr:hypothetical protein CLOM_g6712 [Closterium sp. NIES-68]
MGQNQQMGSKSADSIPRAKRPRTLSMDTTAESVSAEVGEGFKMGKAAGASSAAGKKKGKDANSADASTKKMQRMKILMDAVDFFCRRDLDRTTVITQLDKILAKSTVSAMTKGLILCGVWQTEETNPQLEKPRAAAGESKEKLEKQMHITFHSSRLVYGTPPGQRVGSDSVNGWLSPCRWRRAFC